MRRGTIILIAVILALGAMGFFWWQRDRLSLWFDLRRLADANAEQMSVMIAELMQRESEAVPLLVSQLEEQDERLTRGCGQALLGILRRHGVQSARTEQVVGVLANRFERFSPSGQNQVLGLLTELLQASAEHPSKPLVDASGQVLKKCTEDCLAQRESMMRLAAWVAKHPQGEPWWAACRSLTMRGLSDPNAKVRAAAVQTALNPDLQLLEQLPKMLYAERVEQDAEVRMFLLLGLGNKEAYLPTDQLLTYLHDPEPEIGEIALQALKSRGLTPERIRLAQLVSNPDPVMRSKVPSQLLEVPELDVGLWLEKLSHDPSPAVRAAVVRTAGEIQEAKFLRILERLSEKDPNPTVQQLANFYLSNKNYDHR